MFLRGKVFQMIALTAVVLIIAAINTPQMFNIYNIRQLLLNITIAGIFICGVSPLLMSGGIDFAGTAIGNCGAVAFAMLFVNNVGTPWWVWVVPALIIGGLMGAINAFFVIKLNMMAFIATMAMASIWQALVTWLVKSVAIPIPAGPFTRLSAVFVFDTIPLFFIVMIVLVFIYSVILIKTSFGRSVLMCGGNASAARLAGLKPNKVRTILFINSGVVAALGGMVRASQTRLGSHMTLSGLQPHMSAFIASILGGVSFFGGSGSLAGGFFGVALINTLSYSLLAMGVDVWVNGLINGSLLIIALTIDDVSRRMRMRRLGIKAGSNNLTMPGMSR
jgi:ribose/xylose/arabinose/galactoside ABC-type transport system permease subunit